MKTTTTTRCALCSFLLIGSTAFGEQPWGYWRDPTNITMQLYLNTVRLEVFKNGRSYSGTAFLLNADGSHPSGRDLFLVTNRHLVKGFDTGKIFSPAHVNNRLLSGQPITQTITNWEAAWFCHPSNNVDVAILPPGTLINTPAVWISVSATNPVPLPAWIPFALDSVCQATNQYANESAPVFFVGYPANVYDATNNLPIIRRGSIATPLRLDFLSNPCFAIDAAVFPGSSGSPVWLYDPLPQGPTVLRLIGVIASSYSINVEGKWRLQQIPTAWEASYTNAQPFNLGVAYRAETIMQTLEAYKKQLKHK